MKFHFGLILIFVGTLCAKVCHSQITIKGQIIDGATGESLYGAVIGDKSSGNGTATDFDGAFTLKVNSVPITLSISLTGYITLEQTIASVDKIVIIRLSALEVTTGDVEIVSDRILQKQKQNPLTVETMDLIAIKDAASGSFYESIGSLKGVDMTTASLGFRIINTRGFNSTSPVRTLQLIDGVDNQSPGLNFSLGNFLGACDLDVKKVEIVQGASSSFYGPGAFNGVVNMETKDPWTFQGLSAQLKVGERSLIEPQIRWAESFKTKEDKDFLAYKVCIYYLNALDWEADNYEPITNSFNKEDNPGRYDAVNVYGDEYFPGNDLKDATPWTFRGIETFYRTGYKEADVLDYTTENLKGNIAVHIRLNPDLEYNSPELILAKNVGFGTTVYQGDNRFRLRDIFFTQNRIELKKKDSYFVRIYNTREDAGKSYDPYATSLKLLDEARSNSDWSKIYLRYWQDSINSRINGTGYPGLVPNPNPTSIDDLFLPYDSEGQQAWLVANQDVLTQWHSMVENWTNNGNGGLVGLSSVGYFLPGTEVFNEAFNRITSLKNNEGEGGTRFFDRSALFHAHAEKQFSFKNLDELRFGANARLYKPNSDGTIFSDTNSIKITNFEFGVYTGAQKKLMEDRLILSATVRMDKNQNFDAIVSPALSLVYSPVKNHFARISFSTALRNPTLADQYLYLNVGPATLVGNLNGVDSLVTLDSWSVYRNDLKKTSLDYFNINPIQPEQVRTIEAGYRASLGKNVYADAGYYFSSYTNFIGYLIGLKLEFEDAAIGGLPTSVKGFRYAANSLNNVQTQGFSIGLNYYLGKYVTLLGNYSWNKLVKTNADDPIIPAFNTPEHKYNIGFTARGLKFSKNDRNEFGLGANYKWIKEFVFEGSPQFTGIVPSYDLVDAQMNYKFTKLNSTIKIGCSNMLNNMSIQTYGGPRIGRMAYFSLLYEL